MVFKRFVEGTVTKKSQAKVVLYTCPVDIMQTETSVRYFYIIELCTLYY